MGCRKDGRDGWGGGCRAVAAEQDALGCFTEDGADYYAILGIVSSEPCRACQAVYLPRSSQAPRQASVFDRRRASN